MLPEASRNASDVASSERSRVEPSDAAAQVTPKDAPPGLAVSGPRQAPAEPFGFAYVTSIQEASDQTWMPRLVDGAGRVEPEPADGRLEQWSSIRSVVMQRNGETAFNLTPASPFNLYLSGGRLVLVSDKLHKGSTWWGSPSLALTATAFSYANAARKNRGKFLVGQLRWPWVARVYHTEESARRTASPGIIGLSCREVDGTLVEIALHMTLGGALVRDTGRAIAAVAMWQRRQFNSGISEQEREALSHGPHFSAAHDGSMAVQRIPGEFPVCAETAYPPPPVSGARVPSGLQV